MFHTFEPAADGRSIAIDVEASQHTGTIRFETDPPDARLRVIVERLEGGAVHAATGEILAARPLDLEPGDPRLTARFAAGDALADGIHLRAGDGRAATRAPSLSEQARRHLEALGYGRE